MSSRLPDPLPLALTRVMLRRLSVSDLPYFQLYRADPEVGRYQGWSPMTTQQATEFLTEMGAGEFCVAGRWFQIGIADRLSDRLLGDIGIQLRTEDRLIADIGFTLSRPAQGKGLATEAVRGMMHLLFHCRRVERFEAVTDTRNLGSIRLLERLGMRCEKTVNAIFRDRPCREHVFVVDRDEVLSCDSEGG